MTKQTVYLNNNARKSESISEAVCLLNSPLWERSDDLSNHYNAAVSNTDVSAYTLYWAPPRWLSGEHVGLMTWWL